MSNQDSTPASTNTGTDTRRAVAVGQEIEVILPHSEVCRHMRVAGHLRTIRVLEQSAQILNDDGSPFSFPIGHGEAGVMVRGTEMWVHPIPATLWCVRRDGVRVSPTYVAREDEAAAWLLRHQAHSPDWACTHEGYSIDPVTETDRTQEVTTMTTPETTTSETTTAETGATAAPENAPEVTADTTPGQAGEQEPQAKPSVFLAEFGGYPGGGRGFRRR